ncbi:MAG: aldehyde ferredoxin oxidoreductase C-terminal domain-containing protein, partial [Candidatus Binatia bacterium]|nr:aldehyde ferredoxin oxidoreductase C-terminal domain-containing protein [Candidatus Binatia bacterium]
MAKSPVTGAIGNASIGGYWGPELKFAGYDHLVVEGKADRPVYLYICDDTVEVREANELWGKDCYETPGLLRKQIENERAQVICIGPAGERQVIYATINSSMGNVAARTGLGAVMGSKNLKAIAVRGTRGFQTANPEQFFEECRQLHQLVRSSRVYQDLHTFGLTKWQDKEYQGIYALFGSTWQGLKEIKLQEFLEQNLYKRVGCFGCPVACMDSYNIQGTTSGVVKCSPYADLTYDIQNADMQVFWETMVLCQRYGMDARSVANVLSWLMELYERKIITEDDTDGISLHYGSKEAIIEITRKMIARERIGDLLADGMLEAAKRIGRGSEEFIQHSKGSPIDTHIPPVRGIGLATAVSPTGEGIKGFVVSELDTAITIGTTQNEEEVEKTLKRWEKMSEQVTGNPRAGDPRLREGKAALVRHHEDQNGIGDIVGICTWMTPFMGLPITPKHLVDLLHVGGGPKITTEELMEASTRVRHLQRAYEAREGMTREHDRLPKSFYRELKSDQESKGKMALDAAEL